MADDVVVRYAIDVTGKEQVIGEFKQVNTVVKEVGNEIKKSFAGKAIEDASIALLEQGRTVEALITRYGSAAKANKALNRELENMAALGERNTQEYKELNKLASQFTDEIGDTRNQIKKLASDTRVFDTIAQGARGVTAAFSVALGATALFGEENEDLQKSLLKVQGAMATLQGVQEFANIATEEGGIATQAYGVALKAVEAISKATGLSIAASWALATAGITLVIAGVGYLISQLSFGNDKAKSAADIAKEIKNAKDEQQKLDAETNKSYLEDQKKLQDDFQQGQEAAIRKGGQDEIKAYKERISFIKNVLLPEYESAKKRGAIFGDTGDVLINQAKRDIQRLNDEINKIQVAELKREEKELVDAKERRKLIQESEGMDTYITTQEIYDIKATFAKKIFDVEKQYNKQAYDDSANILTAKLAEEIRYRNKSLEESARWSKKTEEDNAKAFRGFINTIQMPTPLPLPEKTFVDAKKQFQDIVQAAQQTAASISSLFTTIAAAQLTTIQAGFDAQISSLDKWQKRALEGAGDNAQKREAIERRYSAQKEKIDRERARKEAQIRREQAIAEKVFKTFEIVTQTATNVTKYVGGLPATAPLLALAIATGAIQLATVAAAPLPPIPKFEKGGQVLAGGTKKDGHLFGRSHRDGGILINAQGGEYIWDIPTVQKHGDLIKAAHENRIEQLVLHKYVLPAMQNKAAKGSHESYDDFMLRTETKGVRRAVNESTRHIVQAIKEGNNGYVNSRYHG